MKFEVEVGTLRAAVANAKITTDTALPIFQGLYLEATWTENGGKLELYSMKSGSKSLFTIPANVITPGVLVVRGEQVLAGLKGQDDDSLAIFTFSEKLNRLCGACEGSRFKIAILEGSESLGRHLRELPASLLGAATYDGTLLRGVVKRAAWCAYASESSPLIVDALEFKKTDTGYKAIASDGYVAVRVDVTTEHESADITILREPLESVSKFLSHSLDNQIKIKEADPVGGVVREMFFQSSGFFFGASLADRVLPNIESTFMRKDMLPLREVLIPRETLIERLNRISGFVEKASPSVKLTLKGLELILSTASEAGDCVETMDIVYSEKSPEKESQEPVSVAVSNTYLSKMLSSLESEVIILGIRNATSPLVVSDEKNEEINTRYLVMGVRPTLEVLEEASEAELSIDQAEVPISAEEVAEVLATASESESEDDEGPDEDIIDQFADSGDDSDEDDDDDDDDDEEDEIDFGSESDEIPLESVTGA